MLEVLYEDNHMIVCVKPVGVLSQADATGDPDMLTLVAEYLREKYQKQGNVFVGLVHRLDRMVGGVMVFAKTSKGASRLSEQVRNHTFQKTYRALVCGEPSAPSGTFHDYLLKNEKTNMVSVVSKGTPGAKEAILDYTLISYDEKRDLSLVSVVLQTGRTHQIRVQFSSRKHPLYGDGKYGAKDNDKIALHSCKISFTHPKTGKEMVFESKPDREIYNF